MSMAPILTAEWEAPEHLIAAQPLHVQADHLGEKKNMKKECRLFNPLSKINNVYEQLNIHRNAVT